ncbi:DUF2637 domain-containing protein [Streptomyces sp. NPDC059533]|uniref:DUF2637 domain-containing protein n=1 Tax=unclassified Streptomyces TaxID=2593676 RepID=UPI0036A5876B
MTTTIEPGTVPAQVPVSAPGGAVSAAAPAVSAEAVPVSALTQSVSAADLEGLAGWLDGEDGTAVDPAAQPGEAVPQGSSRLRWWLGAVFLLGGVALGVLGFYLSFGNLSTAAHERFDFAPGRDSQLFAIGVDGTILICLVGDLMFATRGRAWWLLRPMAHVFTALTIVLNAIAHGSVLDHWDKALSHAFMPVVFVVLVEAGRYYLVTEAALELGVGRDPIPWHRWLMHPIGTGSIFRTMKTWEYGYSQVRRQRRELAVYEVWLAHREEIETGLAEGKVGVLDRLPVLLAPHGVTVEQALALPARMKRAEQQRQQRAEREARELAAEAARHTRALEHQASMEEQAAEAERLESAGQLAQLRARVAGAEKVAVAEAEGATATAELTARTTLAAAQRAATIEERRTAQEEAAEESYRTAEFKRQAAEAERDTAEAAAKTAKARVLEEKAKAEAEAHSANAAAAARRIAEDKARTAEGNRRTAEANRLAGEDALRTAEAAVLTAAARARAAQAEALADLSATQLKTRVVARLLLANGQADGAEIAAALGGASPAKASTYKKAAEELISRGYNPETGFDPDIPQQQ